MSVVTLPLGHIFKLLKPAGYRRTLPGCRRALVVCPISSEGFIYDSNP